MFWCENMVKDQGEKSGIVALNFVDQSMVPSCSDDSPYHLTPDELSKIDSLIVSHSKTNLL